jgi:hypothetical protein
VTAVVDGSAHECDSVLVQQTGVLVYLPFKLKKLNVRFDARRLVEELEQIPDDWWIHYEFDGTGHDIVPLMTSDGTVLNEDGTVNHRFDEPFRPTPYLDRLPYMAEVLGSFKSPPTRCRLMRVPAGESVKAHPDRNAHWDDKTRLHIPVVTDPAVLFHCWSDNPRLLAADHVSAHMAPGEAWVFNSWYYHSVTNASDVARVHLVGDFRVFDGLDALVFEGCSEAEVEEVRAFEYAEDARRTY